MLLKKIYSILREIIPKQVRVRLKTLHYEVLGKKVVHILHIGKTGGTALRTAITKKITTKRYVVLFSPHNFNLIDIPRGHKVIFILRDPKDRFVSGFFSRKLEGKPRYHQKWSNDEKKAFNLFDAPDKLAKALSSEDTEEQYHAVEAMKSIGHVKDPIIKWFHDKNYFLDRLDDILYIGFTEKLEEDYELIKRKLGIINNAKLPTSEVSAHKTPDYLDKYLSEEAINNLRVWYAEDYQFISLCESILQKGLLSDE